MGVGRGVSRTTKEDQDRVGPLSPRSMVEVPKFMGRVGGPPSLLLTSGCDVSGVEENTGTGTCLMWLSQLWVKTEGGRTKLEVSGGVSMNGILV